jgi:hypothetical protein
MTNQVTSASGLETPEHDSTIPHHRVYTGGGVNDDAVDGSAGSTIRSQAVARTTAAIV